MSFILPENTVDKEQNALLREQAKKVGWGRLGYYQVTKSHFQLTTSEWDLLWVLYPGPSSDFHVFYTNDPFFKTATTEDLRDALKVLLVERKLGGINE